MKRNRNEDKGTKTKLQTRDAESVMLRVDAVAVRTKRKSNHTHIRKSPECVTRTGRSFATYYIGVVVKEIVCSTWNNIN